jgi:hypothetical protein
VASSTASSTSSAKCDINDSCGSSPSPVLNDIESTRSTPKAVSINKPPPAVAPKPVAPRAPFVRWLYPTLERHKDVPPLDMTNVKKKGTAQLRLFTREPFVGPVTQPFVGQHPPLYCPAVVWRRGKAVLLPSLCDSVGDAGGEVEGVGGSSTSSGAGVSSVSQSPVADVASSSQGVVNATSEGAPASEEVCGSSGSSGSSAVSAARGSVALRVACDMCVGGASIEGVSGGSVLAAACAVQWWLGWRCLMAATAGSSSSAEGQVSCGTCGPDLMDVDAVHSSMAAACFSAGDYVTECHLVTGAMARPMLLAGFGHTLTLPQDEVVLEPIVASSSSSPAVSAGGKVGRLLRAAGSVCRFFVRR